MLPIFGSAGIVGLTVVMASLLCRRRHPLAEPYVGCRRRRDQPHFRLRQSREVYTRINRAGRLRSKVGATRRHVLGMKE